MISFLPEVLKYYFFYRNYEQVKNTCSYRFSYIKDYTFTLSTALRKEHIFPDTTNIQKEEQIAKLIESTVLQFIPLFFQKRCALKKVKIMGHEDVRHAIILHLLEMN